MSRQLKREFGIKVPLIRLYDRPTSDFRPATSEERHEILNAMDLSADLQTAFSQNKLRLIVSSTSWTPDEDFSILLDALVGYSKLAVSKQVELPSLLVVITGKGPQKDFYLQKIVALEQEKKLEMITIKTAWFSPPEYAMLLASADIGISLHKSSSGVDLPMKVVDMFGAGLPVVGYGLYESWHELVKEGENGKSFETGGELQSILTQLLGDDGSRLAKLRTGAASERHNDWDTEWYSRAGKIFEVDGQSSPPR